MMLSIFCLLTICVSSLEKYLFRLFSHLKYWVIFSLLSCKKYFCILNNKPISTIWLQAFSPILGLFLFSWFYPLNKSFNFKVQLFFPFFAFLDVISKRPWSNPGSGKFTPMFSSKGFIVLTLTFRSLVHFEWIFACSTKHGSNFILLHVNFSFSHHHLLKRLFFPYWIVLVPLSKWIDHKCESLSSAFSILSHLSICLLNTCYINAKYGFRFLCTWVDLVHIAWRYVLRQSCTTVAWEFNFWDSSPKIFLSTLSS